MMIATTFEKELKKIFDSSNKIELPAYVVKGALNEEVYVVLKTDKDNIATIDRIQTYSKPDEPLYIKGKIRYPQITNHILLKLICMLHKYSNKSCLLVQPYGENIEQLKRETLTSLIIFYKNTPRYKKSIYSKIRTLFEDNK